MTDRRVVTIANHAHVDVVIAGTLIRAGETSHPVLYSAALRSIATNPQLARMRADKRIELSTPYF